MICLRSPVFGYVPRLSSEQKSNFSIWSLSAIDLYTICIALAGVVSESFKFTELRLTAKGRIFQFKSPGEFSVRNKLINYEYSVLNVNIFRPEID